MTTKKNGHNTANHTLLRKSKDPLTIYFVTPEGLPFSQTGGLGEIVPGLTSALARRGHQIKLIMPKYTGTLEVAVKDNLIPRYLGEMNVRPVRIGDHLLKPEVYQADSFVKDLNIETFLIDSESYDYFGNRSYKQLYSHQDDILRFYFFNVIAAELVKAGQNTIAHTHDWQAGHLHTLLKSRHLHKNIPTLHTIHNLAYHPSITRHHFWLMSGLTEKEFPGLYGYRGINFPDSDLADASWAALAIADNVNTVSRRYVKETQTLEYGNGFSELLKRRYEEGKYHGIVNGVDAFWYPQFGINNFVEGKAQKKRETQEAFGLKPDPDALLIMMAARMDGQKGFNLVLPILEKLYTQHKINFQFVISSDISPNGGREIFTVLRKLATQSEIAGRVGVIAPYNKHLTKTVYAGADISLIPSKFEPCGLVAPCSIVNGTIPIGRKVGGIADIIKNGRNGFLFSCDWPRDANSTLASGNKLMQKIITVNTMFQNKPMWHAFIEGLLKEDHSWNQAAIEYEKLYRVTLEQFKNNGHYASFQAPVSL